MIITKKPSNIGLNNKNNFRKSRFWRKIFKNTYLGVLALVSVFTLSLLMKVPLKTSDDSRALPGILERALSKNILGASTENADYLFGCTEQKPVVGWVDYGGNKIIADTLPEGETASSCFANLKEAQEAGFELRK